MRRCPDSASVGSFRSVVIVVLGAAIVAMIWALAVANLPRVNPDYLYTHMLARDLRQHGLDIAWSTPPAPLFFPDLLFHAIAGTLLKGVGPALTGTFALHVVTLWWAVAFFLGCARRDLSRARRWIGAGITVTAWLASWVAHPYFADHVFFVWHANAMAMGIVLSAIALRMSSDAGAGGRARSAALFGLLASLSALSDRIVAGQFLIPLSVTAVLLAARGRLTRRSALAFVALCAGSTIVASLVKRGLRSTGHLFIVTPRTQLDLGELPSALAQFGSDLPILLGPRAALLLGCIGAVIVLRELRREGGDPRVWIGAASVATCTLVLPLLSDNWTWNRHQRYLLPLYFLPFLVPVLWLSLSRWAARDGAWALLALPALVFATGAFVRQERPEREHPLELRLPLVTELDRLHDERGIRFGLGSYAPGKCVAALSQRDLRVNEIKDLAPRVWISNADWFFERDGDEVRWPTYDFLVATGLSASRLREAFGAPSEIVEVEGGSDCAGGSVWLYDRETNPLDTSALRRALPAAVAKRRLRLLADPGRIP